MTCAKQLVRATIITPDGRQFVGTNACANPQALCPRAGMPTGVGYELCQNVCQQQGHAEVQALRAAGVHARGATLILEGHTYLCAACQVACQEAGILRTEIR